jgi:hypothetical protein
MSQQCTPDELSAYLRDGNDDEPLSHMDVVSSAYQRGFEDGLRDGLKRANEFIRANHGLAECVIRERLNEMTKHAEGGK